MSNITINTDLCKRDGFCALVCPEAIFVQNEKGVSPEIVHEDECIKCGQCVSICPQGAILHADFPLTRIREVRQELLPSGEQVMELLRSRRSIRAWRDKPVERDLIEQIIEGARFAPSARNTQSTRFIVVQDRALLARIVELTVQNQAQLVAHDAEVLPAFSRLIEAFHESKDKILHDAPVLLVFHADQREEFVEVNATLALHNSALVCQGLGLGCFFAGYVVAVCQRDDSIPRLLALPDNHRIYGALAIGVPKLKFKKSMEREAPKITWM
jgi:nitroreductase/NAD-dependent dihydropyrimidine dehydrogenase PreA subunit